MGRTTDLEKVKDFLEWLDREIPKEKDEKLKQAMIRIKGLILDRLTDSGTIGKGEDIGTGG